MTETLAGRFGRFAEIECYDSPLYERLCRGIAEDPDLLALAGHALHPVPNLFLASVHYLLLKGARHWLASFYPSVSGLPGAAGDPFPCFRSFCLEHRGEILGLVSTRLVQTNEVGRCAFLMPAFGLVARLSHGRPLALVEIGASAGLNLLWDRYGYDYGDGLRYGNPLSPVRIASRFRGGLRPRISAELPVVASRIGIDLAPVDVRDRDAVLWLRSLVWPEHGGRAELLMRAVHAARDDAPELIAGDALELLPRVLARLPRDAAACVFHTHTLNQFTPGARERLDAMMEEHSAGRIIYRVSAEYRDDGLRPQLELLVHAQGAVKRSLLACYHPHGAWVEWLDAAVGP